MLPLRWDSLHFRRNYGMIGVFADGGGEGLLWRDYRNNVTAKKSTFGIFADVELNKKVDLSKNEPALTPPDSLKEPLRSTIDSLFIQASAAPQKYQYNVEPARNLIVGMGAEALPFLAEKLATESPRERLALDVILPRFLIRIPVQSKHYYWIPCIRRYLKLLL